MQKTVSPGCAVWWPMIGAGGMGVKGRGVTVGWNTGSVGEGNAVGDGSSVAVGGSGVDEGVSGAAVMVLVGSCVLVEEAVGEAVGLGVGVATTSSLAAPLAAAFVTKKANPVALGTARPQAARSALF